MSLIEAPSCTQSVSSIFLPHLLSRTNQKDSADQLHSRGKAHKFGSLAGWSGSPWTTYFGHPYKAGKLPVLFIIIPMDLKGGERWVCVCVRTVGAICVKH